MYIHDWNKKKLASETYIREKVDFYSIEHFGDLENKILDGEYRVVQAYCHNRLPMLAMLTAREEILVLDLAQSKIVNYLVSHFGPVD